MTDLPLLRLDVPSHQAWLGGRELALPPLPYRTLALLAAAAGRVVTRKELMAGLYGTEWGPTKVLDINVSIIRRALGDDAANARYIATVPKVGFRFDPALLDLESLFVQPDQLFPAAEAQAILRRLDALEARVAELSAGGAHA